MNVAHLIEERHRVQGGNYSPPCPICRRLTLLLRADGEVMAQECDCDLTEWICEISEISEQTAQTDRVNSQNSHISHSPQTSTCEPARPVLAPEAYQGALGQLVRLIEPQTEADPAAILMQLLVGFGNAIGRTAYHSIEASRHYCNLFAVIVGRSSRGRKGTSYGYARNALDYIDAEYADNRIVSGLSSGEGVNGEVRDAVETVQTDKKTGEMKSVITDGGIDDKRLLVVEEEFARPLGVMRREGSTLSAVLRQAWDSGRLRVMTKNPTRATDAHISIIGHITEHELRRYLADSVEVLNGFANRFLWIYADRTKRLPFGGNLNENQVNGYHARLREAYQSARNTEYVTWSAAVCQMWTAAYDQLSDDLPGVVGAFTSRSEAQVLRLMTIYALADGSAEVQSEHFEAAVALWDYSAATCAYLFGGSTDDAVADRILQLLRQNPEGLDRTALTKQFGNHVSGVRLQSSLALLQEHSLASETRIVNPDGGRPRAVWRLTAQQEVR